MAWLCDRREARMAASRTDQHRQPESIVLIDGVCVLCSRAYRFVSARDHARQFRFVAVQQTNGRAIAARYGIDPDDPATFILVDHDMAYTRSDAALRILARLPGWGWTRGLRLAPKAWRDAVYDLVARNRYRWFGRYDVCIVPTAARPDP
jgi:predicted DCC family thiol-disulfide oxidoreductase YuxK